MEVVTGPRWSPPRPRGREDPRRQTLRRALKSRRPPGSPRTITLSLSQIKQRANPLSVTGNLGNYFFSMEGENLLMVLKYGGDDGATIEFDENRSELERWRNVRRGERIELDIAHTLFSTVEDGKRVNFIVRRRDLAYGNNLFDRFVLTR